MCNEGRERNRGRRREMIGKEKHYPDFCKVKLCGFKPPKLCKVWIGNRYRKTVLLSKRLPCASYLKKFSFHSCRAFLRSTIPFPFMVFSFFPGK